MPAVAVPSTKSAAVSFTLRPQRRCTVMNNAVPNGREMKANEKIANAYSSPCRSSANGKKTWGNTRTAAMPNTKKSKYSEARPTTTPTAISSGAMRDLLP